MGLPIAASRDGVRSGFRVADREKDRVNQFRSENSRENLRLVCHSSPKSHFGSRDGLALQLTVLVVIIAKGRDVEEFGGD